MTTSSDTIAPIESSALQAALSAVEPNVLLAPPWLLQAVIAQQLAIVPGGLAVPDEQLYVIRRDQFVRFIDDRDLPLPEDLPAGPNLILLERPEPDSAADLPTPRLLLHYWRLLTRARVESQVREALVANADSPGGYDEARLDLAIDRIGFDVFNEARQVLTRERRLLTSASKLDAYAKFAAAFVDLRAFTPKLMSHVFPAIEDPDRVAAIVEMDLPRGLVADLRPAGAPEPQIEPVLSYMGPPRRPSAWSKWSQWWGTTRHRRAERRRDRRAAKVKREALLTAAEQASDVGNDVRAGMLRARAYRAGSDVSTKAVPTAALADLDRLIKRLAAALKLSRQGAAEWRDALRPLLGPASAGWWNAERRLLYDLQRVCIDHEREIYSVNVIEWLMELCRRPLFRPLPRQRLALTTRRLRAAMHRLTSCRLSAQQRDRLEHLLHDAAHESEHQLREELTPLIATVLDQVGLRAENPVEAVGRRRMTQEMIDIIVRDGYLTFAGVRDTISRNSVRCHDLRTVAEWLGYDQLMKLDRRLGEALDGVYRRGEIYRYLFQKFSSLLFANPVGRFLTLTIILPVAGAYLLLEALQHTLGSLLTNVFHIHTHMLPVWKAPPDPLSDPAAAAAVAEHFNPATLYTNPWTFAPLVATTLFLFLVINWPKFRQMVGRGFGSFFRGLGFVFFELPEKLIKTPFVQALLNSRELRLVFRYAVKPLVLVLIAWWFLPHDASAVVQAAIFVAIFLLVNLVVNSRPGRAVEQSVLYALRVGWVRFTVDKIATVFRGIMRFFGRLMETVDRMLYAVDEWLRFRDGGGRRTLIVKAILGVAWFYIAYIFRFVLTLLVEPQVNPIKHFPVVTVSHKLLLPLAIPGGEKPSPMGGVIVWLFGASKATADATAATIVWGIPGIFGFLAWELKENWNLYRVNRPRTLRPVRFGSHGESLAQLLRPGFHSGTLPKAFTKLRKAHRNADRSERPEGAEFPLTVHKHLETIEHVDEALRQFVDRTFLAQLNRHPAFIGAEVTLVATKLGVTRIVLDLHRSGADSGDLTVPMRIEFEQIAGWVVAEVPEPGWSRSLSPAAADIFAGMLRGFYKMAAVDIVRSDVDAVFSPRQVDWELTPKKLVVRPIDRPLVRASYALYQSLMHPQFKDGETDPSLPVIPRQEILFRAREIAWADWVDVWSTSPAPRATADTAPAAAQPEHPGVNQDRHVRV